MPNSDCGGQRSSLILAKFVRRKRKILLKTVYVKFYHSLCKISVFYLFPFFWLLCNFKITSPTQNYVKFSMYSLTLNPFYSCFCKIQ